MNGFLAGMWGSGLSGNPKRVVALLGVAVLGGGMIVWLATAGGSRGRSPVSVQGGSKREAEGAVGQAARCPLFATDPNFSGKGTEGLEAGELFYKMLVLVAVVLGLGIGGSYVSKKFGTRISKLSSKEIHVLETAHLGSAKVLHLVGIGPRRLLVASTNENITVLADVTEALAESQMSSEQSGQTFADHLS